MPLLKILSYENVDSGFSKKMLDLVNCVMIVKIKPALKIIRSLKVKPTMTSTGNLTIIKSYFV